MIGSNMSSHTNCMKFVVILLAIATAVIASGCQSSATVHLTVSPIGIGHKYHPLSLSQASAAGQVINGLRCSRRSVTRFGAHVELFAHRKVVIVPAGIGIAPPRRTDGPYVSAGRCSYPIRTVEPTGVIDVSRAAPLTLGQLFAIWGQRLSAHRLLSFTTGGSGRVIAFVDGVRWLGNSEAIPLHRHTQLVLEIGGYVPPHRHYRFAQDL